MTFEKCFYRILVNKDEKKIPLSISGIEKGNHLKGFNSQIKYPFDTIIVANDKQKVNTQELKKLKYKIIKWLLKECQEKKALFFCCL